MRKLFIFLIPALLLAVGSTLKAASPTPDEGMWLPLLIKRLNYDEMKKMGCKLTPEEIYSVNKSSLKDAIVQLGGFCTAEVVSDQGLILTNHHCGYDAIASHSTPEANYLDDGFWAASKEDEIPTPRLTVSFLVRMEDVTDRIISPTSGLPPEEVPAKMDEIIREIEAEASEEGKYRVEVKDMFYGNEYYLFVYETFRDIRLVGAPPSAVGKFGGDTDNWMWPRHTGDFSMFRIYAGPDNGPADYAEENKPYKPKHFLPINLRGLKEGDFNMIMGYPGSTDRFLTSFAIEAAHKTDNHDVIKIAGERLRIMKADMDKDEAIRIKLASSYASLSNTYKYYVGQTKGLDSRGLEDEKRAQEAEFTKWVNKDPKRKEEYGDVLSQIEQNYNSTKEISKLSNYMNIAGFGPGMVVYGIQYYRIMRTLEREEAKFEDVKPMLDNLQAGLDGHFDEYFAATDQKLLATTARLLYENLPAKFHPATFTGKFFTKKAKGDNTKEKFDNWAEAVFAKSFLVNKDRARAFTELSDVKKINKAIDKDPGMEYVNSIIDVFRTKLQMGMAQFSSTDEELMKSYTKGMMEMNKDKEFYPNANFTMRLTYGKVIPYIPRDAVAYKAFTTHEGILEKEIPGDEEFHVPQKLHDLLVEAKFGEYGENGKLPVCFLNDTDITGGNSGSPVINGEGHLVGIAFDGNWESMTSDLVFDPGTVRTISVDIRYVAFIIDKYAGARHLLDEMEVIQ